MRDGPNGIRRRSACRRHRNLVLLTDPCRTCERSGRNGSVPMAANAKSYERGLHYSLLCLQDRSSFFFMAFRRSLSNAALIPVPA